MKIGRWAFGVGLLCLCAGQGLRAQEDLVQREEAAVQKAVQRVANSVVSIDTVGGLESVGGVLFGTGPTTGTIVSEDGYIVSSAFNFAQKPTSILVGLPDGTRTPARLVATDHNRMLVLLKVNVDERLAVPTAVREAEILVGQWSIAVGRTFDGAQPNVSVGIVSATGRIWGKAIQTDAKVSPSNYGGPLVDIRGRVQGLLVPLSPNAAGEVAGVEWYDSGIGFAVPLAQINQILPKLKQGQDLFPGVMGVSLTNQALFAGVPVIAACFPNSPAYKAGLHAGDQIVQIDDVPIERQVQLLNEIHRRYAGDMVHVAVLRNGERIERDIPLVEKLEPFQRAWLGILPRRDAPRASSDAASPESGSPATSDAGVTVRYVFPDSPAALAGVQVGDHVLSLNGQACTDRAALAVKMNTLEVGQQARLEVRRGEEVLSLELKLSPESEALPGELPPARESHEASVGERPQTGSFALKVPEFQNDCRVYVPEAYDPALKYGILIWLHAPGGFQDEEFVARWKPHCDRDDLILVAPKAVDATRWQNSDVEFIRKALDDVRAKYSIEPSRIVAHGHETGGALAFVLAFNQRDLVRAVAVVDAPMSVMPPENDPVYPLAIYMTSATKSTFAPQIQAAIELLRQRKYPVTIKDLGEQGRYLANDELAEMLRWVDALDRI